MKPASPKEGSPNIRPVRLSSLAKRASHWVTVVIMCPQLQHTLISLICWITLNTGLPQMVRGTPSPISEMTNQGAVRIKKSDHKYFLSRVQNCNSRASSIAGHKVFIVQWWSEGWKPCDSGLKAGSFFFHSALWPLRRPLVRKVRGNSREAGWTQASEVSFIDCL